MEKDEKKIELKNTELSLAFLKNKVNEESKKLSELYAKKIVINESVQKIKDGFAKERKEIDEAKKILDDDKSTIADEKKKSEQALLRASDEKRVIDSQKNEAMKELARINDWILTAEKNKKELEDKTKTLDEQIKEKEIVVADLEKLKNDQTNANIKLSQTKLETDSMVKEATGRVNEAERKVKEKETRGLELDTEYAKAKEKLDKIINESERINHDLLIYIERVEEKYQEAFPDLKIKL